MQQDAEIQYSQRYVVAKGFMVAVAALEIDGYCCHFIQKCASSLSLNSISRGESYLISINS
jgi:hypothetical protein